MAQGHGMLSDQAPGGGVPGGGNERRHTRRVVLGAAATLGMLAPAAPALAAGTAGNGEPGSDAVPGPREASEVWGTSASGHGAGVRGNGRWGVVGEGTHSGVKGDGFVGVRGTTSIVRNDERGVAVWAEAVAPGSTALRADGPSEFNGVTRFSRSGVAAVRAGTTSVTVTDVALTQDSAVLATLQNRVHGVYLHAAETDPAAGSFTIFLTAAPAQDVRVAWFAVG
jgi:hypothetical protein